MSFSPGELLQGNYCVYEVSKDLVGEVTLLDGDYRMSFSTSPRRPGTWRFKAKFKKQSLTGPLQGPATATLTYGPSTDRTGSVADCKSTFTSMTCRDFK